MPISNLINTNKATDLAFWKSENLSFSKITICDYSISNRHQTILKMWNVVRCLYYAMGLIFLLLNDKKQELKLNILMNRSNMPVRLYFWSYGHHMLYFVLWIHKLSFDTAFAWFKLKTREWIFWGLRVREPKIPNASKTYKIFGLWVKAFITRVSQNWRPENNNLRTSPTPFHIEMDNFIYYLLIYIWIYLQKSLFIDSKYLAFLYIYKVFRSKFKVFIFIKFGSMIVNEFTCQFDSQS